MTYDNQVRIYKLRNSIVPPFIHSYNFSRIYGYCFRIQGIKHILYKRIIQSEFEARAIDCCLVNLRTGVETFVPEEIFDALIPEGMVPVEATMKGYMINGFNCYILHDRNVKYDIGFLITEGKPADWPIKTMMPSEIGGFQLLVLSRLKGVTDLFSKSKKKKKH